MKTYEYEPRCTISYDGLYCDGPCAECDAVAAGRAQDRADSERELRDDASLDAWIQSTPGAQ